MSPKTDNQIMTPRRRGRRRAAIIGLASLTALAILVPPSAPLAGAGAIICLIVGFLRRSGESVTTDALEHSEPNLWDDGFGAT